MTSWPVDAEALFGSAARRDGDGFSDIDYLIVGNDTKALRARKEYLRGHGFSVSAYTWNRLQHLCANQTLFSIHLKLEARVVFDKDGRLTELLKLCQPKDRYLKDLEQSLELFRPLEHVPPKARGRAWAFDTLAVGFRNSAILMLADRGRYVFSMNAIIESFQSSGQITAEDARNLHRLRTLKANYRSGRPLMTDDVNYSDVVFAVQAALKIDFDSKDLHARVHPLADIKGSCSTSAYAAMRAIEAELITIPESLARIPRVAELSTALMHSLRNPHEYLWSFMHRPDEIKAQLSELRTHY